MKKWLTIGTVVTSLLLFTGCSNGQEAAPKKEETSNKETKQKQETPAPANAQDFYKQVTTDKIDHIHGIGYPGNMPGITIATHNGLKVYQEGKWLVTKGQNNDYMGFQANKEGFFASGHPGKDSDLKNPLGLIKSNDGGNIIETLAFYGESDFHYLAAGYNNKAVYVFNEQPNSKLKNGFYYSTDEGKTWKQSKLDGLPAAAMMFAVHPDESNVLAMTTEQGVYLSTDYGNTFKLFSNPLETAAITMGSEDIIYSYTKDEKQGLMKQSLSTSDTIELNVPSLDSKDRIMYVAQNPKNPIEIVFATMNSNVFLTTDEGKTWTQIAKNGSIQ